MAAEVAVAARAVVAVAARPMAAVAARAVVARSVAARSAAAAAALSAAVAHPGDRAACAKSHGLNGKPHQGLVAAPSTEPVAAEFRFSAD